MSNNNNSVAGVVHVGSRPSQVQTLVFVFHDFANLGDYDYTTPRILCNGFHWSLFMYPNGKNEETRGHVGLYLICWEVREGSVESVRANFAIQVPNHPNSFRQLGAPKTFAKPPQCSWGLDKCWIRDEAVAYCDAGGTLEVQVSLLVYPDEQAVNCWKPGKSISAKVASLYKSKSGVDAAFCIGSRRFEVHRWLLELSSPTLAGMFDNDTSTSTANQADVPITGADPDLFETLIRFLYTEDLPPSFNDDDDALELLKLADKFGCSDLKMLLEARIVETPTLFCIKNAADLLVLADAINCALLLERSLKLIAENLPNVKATEGWKHVKESIKLMEAIIDAQSNLRGQTTLDACPDSASISVLRKRAFEEGLGADGTRQDLIKRLKTAHADEEASNTEDASVEE